MKIDPIYQALGVEIQKVSGQAKNVEKAEKGNKLDSVTLSKKAQELSRASDIDAVSRQIANIPDIRTEKVQTVKARVAAGYYETPQFMDQLAEKLIKDFGLSA